MDEKSLISGIDWLPSLCRLTGAKLPAADIDGEDVSDVWLGTPRGRTKPLFWKTSNVRSEIAFLADRWKLIAKSGRRGEVELYDLATDQAESHDVAAEHPDIVKSLRGKVDAWNATLPTEYIKTATNDDNK